MSNVIEFPRIFDSNTPSGVADALKDFVKDKPDAKLIVLIKDDENDILSMGWNHMNATDMALMLKFADYKYMSRTFGYVYVEEEEDDEE